MHLVCVADQHVADAVGVQVVELVLAQLRRGAAAGRAAPARALVVVTGLGVGA